MLHFVGLPMLWFVLWVVGMQWLSILAKTMGAGSTDIAHNATLLSIVDSLLDNWSTIVGVSFWLRWFGNFGGSHMQSNA